MHKLFNNKFKHKNQGQYDQLGGSTIQRSLEGKVKAGMMLQKLLTKKQLMLVILINKSQRNKHSTNCYGRSRLNQIKNRQDQKMQRPQEQPQQENYAQMAQQMPTQQDIYQAAQQIDPKAEEWVYKNKPLVWY